MVLTSTFRRELEEAVNERHCADHPLTLKWAAGELSRQAMAGWAIEHYHWISQMGPCSFYKLAKAPLEVQRVLLDNFFEERDPDRPHLPIVLKFARANGVDEDTVKRGRGLPTTEAWVAWLTRVCKEEPWVAGVAATTIGTESQSPRLYSRILPACREIYKFPEDEIEHFWLHAEADVEHGGRGFDMLEKYAATREEREMAVHYARESARMRWFHFDGIYLHYEVGYKLR